MRWIIVLICAFAAIVAAALIVLNSMDFGPAEMDFEFGRATGGAVAQTGGLYASTPTPSRWVERGAVRARWYFFYVLSALYPIFVIGVVWGWMWKKSEKLLESLLLILIPVTLFVVNLITNHWLLPPVWDFWALSLQIAMGIAIWFRRAAAPAMVTVYIIWLCVSLIYFIA